MDLKFLADYISINLPDAWKNNEHFLDSFHEDWLLKLDFSKICDYYEIKEYEPIILSELNVITNDAALNRICYLVHKILFFTRGADYLSVWTWNGNGELFKNHGSYMLFAIAVLAGQPIHEKNLKERDYEEEQEKFSRRGVRGALLNEKNKLGIQGLRPSFSIWPTIFMRCSMVRIGALEYEVGIKSYPDIEKRLGGNVAFVYIHIPGGGKLLPEIVDASLSEAKRSISRYFPEVLGKKIVFCTVSWLLSPELSEILPENSNIRSFADRFTIERLYEGYRPFLDFAFKVDSQSPSLNFYELPESTSLLRALKAKILAGEPLHQALGYFEYT